MQDLAVVAAVGADDEVEGPLAAHHHLVLLRAPPKRRGSRRRRPLLLPNIEIDKVMFAKSGHKRASSHFVLAQLLVFVSRVGFEYRSQKQFAIKKTQLPAISEHCGKCSAQWHDPQLPCKVKFKKNANRRTKKQFATNETDSCNNNKT